jgi:hypothetical protein
MNMVRKLPVMAATLAAATTLGAGGVVLSAGAAPAQASVSPAATTAVAAGALQCSGDLCIQNISASGVTSNTIRAWADTKAFTGHFELVFSDGVVKNSPTQSWAAGGSGFKFTGVPIGDGYRITAWKGKTSPFTNIGTVGFLVS